MNKCVFCEIVSGKVDSAQIWSNDEFVAFLALHPNVKGQCLVVSKKHYFSDLHDMPEDVYKSFFLAARDVIEKLKKKLKVKRVAMVVEGMGIDHAHIKLYPLYGLEKTFQETLSKEKVFFDKYQGYITTQRGHTATLSDLKKLAQDIIK